MVLVTSLVGLEDAFFEKRALLLPEEKRRQLSAIKNVKSIKETTLAWLLLRRALGMKSDEKFPPLSFSDRGKPCFENSEFRFNLSHSSSMVCVAVSTKEEIGVDVQKKSFFSEKVKKRVFCTAEIKSGEAYSDPDLYFTRLWAIKESYLKQTGVGIAFDFRRLDFSKECRKSYFEKNGLCYTVKKIESYCFSVCTTKKGKQVFVNVQATDL